MKKTNTKKYVIAVIICSILIIALYATCTAIYMNSVMDRNKKSATSELEEYGEMMQGVDIDTITKMTSSYDSMYKDLINPNISIILYKTRSDGTAEYSTTDSFLMAHQVPLSGMLNVVEKEKIASHDFLIYQYRVEGSSYYVKLVMPFDGSAKYYIDYAIALLVFIVLVAIICILIIFVYNKLIFDNIKKQRAFINDMSHEIRTPLTVIKGNLENILASPNSTIIDVSDRIESSISEVDHLTQLSQNLLNIVSDTRSAVNKKMSYNLSDMVAGVLDVYSDIISGSNKTLIANIDSISAMVDTEKIKQLVIILLDNAIKYTCEGDKIRVQLKRHENAFELIVSDTGIGIADEDKEKIFERFYRGANAKEQSGTGLGLSIAKGIVESHGGRISATHNIPSGLVISVYIPSKN